MTWLDGIEDIVDEDGNALPRAQRLKIVGADLQYDPTTRTIAATVTGGASKIPVNDLAITKGTCLVYDTATSKYKIASSANVGATKTVQYCATTDAVDEGGGVYTVEFAKSGDVLAPSVTGLGAGSQQRVRVNPTTGKFERVDVIGPTDYEGGIALADGTVAFVPDTTNPDQGELKYVSPLKFGATGDGTTGDAAVINALIQAIGTSGGYRGARVVIDLAPRGASQSWVLDDDLIINDDSTTALAGLIIRGGEGSPGQDYLHLTQISYKRACKKFASKTVTCVASALTANGNIQPYNCALKLSGSDIDALGIDQTDVLYREMRISNSSYSAINGYAKIVRYHNSGGTNYLTLAVIIAGGTLGSIPGSITLDLTMLDSPIRLNARNAVAKNVYIVADGANVKMEWGVSTSQSPNAGGTANTRCRVHNVTVDSKNGATAVHATNIGAVMLPQSGSGLYTDSGLGFPLPYMPTNCDYLTLDTVTCSYGASGAFAHTHNTTHQNRGHRFIECGSVGGGRFTSVDSVMDNGLGTSSMSFSAYECSGGQQRGMFQLGIAQAPILIVYPHVELAGKLIENAQSSLASKHMVTVLGGYLYIGGQSPTGGYMRSPFVEVNNMDLHCRDVKFSMTGDSPAAGTVLFKLSGYKPTLTLDGCELPDPDSADGLNGGAHFEIGSITGSDAVINIKDCTQYNYDSASTSNLRNERIVRSYATNTAHNQFSATVGDGTNASNLSGISATRYPADNLIGECVVFEDAVRGVVPFASLEGDTRDFFNDQNDCLKILAVPSGYSGSPSANSAIVKETGAGRKYAYVEVDTAPGAAASGKSRTFQLFAVRHNNVRAAEWHPGNKSSLALWLVSDIGFPDKNRDGNYTFWRNLVARRHTEGVYGQSRADPNIDSDALPTRTPGITDAAGGLNGRPAITCAHINDFLQLNDGNSEFPCLATPCTIFVVAQASSDFSYHQSPIGTQSDGIVIYCNTSGEIEFRAGGTTVTLTGTDWSAAPKVVAIKVIGASSKHFVNTTTGTGITLGSSSPAASDIWCVTASGSGAYSWRGKLGEILVFREALSDAEIASEMQRLGTAWGITIS